MPKTIDNLTVDDTINVNTINVKRVYGGSGYIQFDNTNSVDDAFIIFPTVGTTQTAVPDLVKETRFIRGLPIPTHPFQYFFQANASISCDVPFNYPSGNVATGTYSALIYFMGAPFDKTINITGTIKTVTSAVTAYPPFLVLTYTKEAPWGSGDVPHKASLWDPIARKNIAEASPINKAPTMIFSAACMILSNKS